MKSAKQCLADIYRYVQEQERRAAIDQLERRFEEIRQEREAAEAQEPAKAEEEAA